MYTGRVHVGGAADVHELGRLMISKIAVGDMSNNAYLLRDRETGEQLLIDAAAETDRLLRLVGDQGLATVVTTHAHADHWQALAAVVADTGATTMAHAEDAPEIPVPTDVLLHDGDTVRCGTAALQVIHLVGHTPGSIALLYEDPLGHPHLFTGDCLFPGGIGKTWSSEHFTSLLTDVETKLFAVLPDDTWVYPGHGDDTTLGAERPHLAEWRARGW